MIISCRDPKAPDAEDDKKANGRTEQLTSEEIEAELVEWIEALEQTGTRGAMGFVNRCYEELEEKATIRTLDLCLIIDLFATRAYEPKARYHGSVTEIGKVFFSGDETKRRVILACDRLSIPPESCRQRLLQIHESVKPLFNDVILRHI